MRLSEDSKKERPRGPMIRREEGKQSGEGEWGEKRDGESELERKSVERAR